MQKSVTNHWYTLRFNTALFEKQKMKNGYNESSDSDDNKSNQTTNDESNSNSEDSSSESLDYDEMSLEELRDLYNDSDNWGDHGDDIVDCYEAALRDEYILSIKSGDYKQALELLHEIDDYCHFEYEETIKFIECPSYVLPEDVTALQMAVIFNNAEKVDEILDGVKDNPGYILKCTGEHLGNQPFHGNALHYALHSSKTTIVCSLINFIKRYISINDFRQHLWTGDHQNILHLAVKRKDDLEVVKSIIDLYSFYYESQVISFIQDGADQQVSSEFVTHLHQTFAAHAVVSKEFVELIDARNSQGESPLYLSVKTHRTEVVALLAPHSRYINHQFEDRNTVLHIASQKGFRDIVIILLKHKKIKLNIENSDLNTPLLLAILNDQQNIAVQLCREIGTSYAEDSGINKIVSKEEALERRAKHQISDEIDEEYGATASDIEGLLNGDKIELVLEEEIREKFGLEDPLIDIKQAAEEELLQPRMQELEEDDENPERYEKTPLYLAIEKKQCESVQAILALPATDLENRGQENRAITIAKKMVGEDTARLVLNLRKDIQAVIRKYNFDKYSGIKKYITASLSTIETRIKKKNRPLPDFPDSTQVKQMISNGKLSELIEFLELLPKHREIEEYVSNCISHINTLKETRLKTN